MGSTGKPLNTLDNHVPTMFVMDTEGKVYAGPQKFAEFHHSSFLAGKPVAAAGEIEVIDGTLTSYSGKSGHYKPTQEQLGQFTSELKSSGADMSQAIEIPID